MRTFPSTPVRIAFALPAVVLVATLLAAAASPARAGEVCEGENYTFRVPDGFQALDAADRKRGRELRQALEAFDALFGAGLRAEAHAFVAGDPEAPDAVLGAMAFELKGDLAKMAEGNLDLDTLERSLREGMERSPVSVESLRRVPVGTRQEALELEFTGDDPRQGRPVTARLAILVADHRVVMLFHQGAAENAAADEPVWRGLVSSFRLESGGRFTDLLLRYGPFVAGGVILLLGFVLMRRPRARWSPSTPRTAPAEHAAGISRASDGLPLYGDGGGAAPAPAGPARAGHGVPRLARVAVTGGGLDALAPDSVPAPAVDAPEAAVAVLPPLSRPSSPAPHHPGRPPLRVPTEAVRPSEGLARLETPPGLAGILPARPPRLAPPLPGTSGLSPAPALRVPGSSSVGEGLPTDVARREGFRVASAPRETVPTLGTRVLPSGTGAGGRAGARVRDPAPALTEDPADPPGGSPP